MIYNKNFLRYLFGAYDQVQIGTTGKGKYVQKQKGGDGSRQLQIAHLKTEDGEEIHVNYNRVQKKSLWQKLCGWFAGEKPNGDYRKETK